MMTKEEYKRELIRMWDSVRHCDYKGEKNCHGIACGRCPLNQYCSWCSREDVAYNAFEIIETVEKWSKEHQPKKYKVSRFEYDTLKSCIECLLYGKFFDNELLMSLLEKGYFQGAKKDTYVDEYFDNCEVEND